MYFETQQIEMALNKEEREKIEEVRAILEHMAGTALKYGAQLKCGLGIQMQANGANAALSKILSMCI